MTTRTLFVILSLAATVTITGLVLFHKSMDSVEAEAASETEGRFATEVSEQAVPGILRYRREALAEVVREISLYTTTQIELDPRLNDLEITGYFRAGDLAGFLSALQSFPPIDVRYIDSGHVRIAECAADEQICRRRSSSNVIGVYPEEI